MAAAIPNALLLVGRAGEDRWHLIEAATGSDAVTNAEFSLPVGAPREGWGRIVSATVEGDRTVVRDDVVQPGFGGPSLTLDGRWRLPTIGGDPVPAGRSLDGSTIVLVEAEAGDGAAAAATTTRFAVVQHEFQGKPSTVGDADLRLVKIVELRGRFEYDTMSPNGRVLYVVEHLDEAAGGHYQVRAVDLPSGVMREAVIVDKANPDERMAGYVLAQVRRADGVVLTLYDGPEHPFIHALQAAEGWALCIDLPAEPAATAEGWGLTASANARTVFAVNATAGLAVEVSVGDLSVIRTSRLATTAAAPSITLAKFGHADVGPVGRGLVALPDGSGLLAASSDGVAVLSLKELNVTARTLQGQAIDAIGVTPDGTVAFALARDGRLTAFEPRSGRVFGEVGGGPWSSMLAVAPW